MVSSHDLIAHRRKVILHLHFCVRFFFFYAVMCRFKLNKRLVVIGGSNWRNLREPRCKESQNIIKRKQNMFMSRLKSVLAFQRNNIYTIIYSQFVRDFYL